MGTSSVAAGSIVVGIDGSEHSARAAAWAADVAAVEQRRLVLVHSVQVASGWLLPPIVDVGALNEDFAAAAEALVEDTRQRLQGEHDGLEMVAVCTPDDPRDILVELSRDAHLVVVGARGRGTLRRLVLGSVSSGVVRHARCPVVILPANAAQVSGHGVAVGVGGTRWSGHTLELAFRAASWRNEPLRAVHCNAEPITQDRPVRVAPHATANVEDRLLVSELFAGLREKYPDVDVTVEIHRGVVDEVLRTLAEAVGLVVVGSQEHNAMTDFVIGSVATALIERSPCPVAVLPHGCSH